MHHRFLVFSTQNKCLVVDGKDQTNTVIFQVNNNNNSIGFVVILGAVCYSKKM